jgi:hypothetical protein
MQIRGEGLVDADRHDAPATGQKTVYVLHPNCAVDVE